MPILGELILPGARPADESGAGTLTEDGALALGVTAESAQAIAGTLAAAAAEVRRP
jgi:hypothetical protein